MESTRLQEVTLQGDFGGRGRRLPFSLGGQPGPRPAGEGVGLVVTDMADWLVEIQASHAFEGEDLAPARGRFPVERGSPAVAIARVPAVREPEFGTFVTAVIHEGQIFAVGHHTIGQRERGDVLQMFRSLVVEGKACRLMADRPQAARKRNPAWSSGPSMRHGVGPTLAISRASGIARQRGLISVRISSWC